jgi:5-formyltetrahydrofolate cyclo-ligase
MNISEEKAKIRKEMKRRRSELSSDALSRIDASLPDLIFSIDDEELQTVLRNAKRIALYRAFKGEAPVDGLARAFMERGIKCCFPRIIDGSMIFCDCEDLDGDEFEISSFGIKEPAAYIDAVDPSTIDVVVLPAVAYNEEGSRLGMGGGYYDRFAGSLGADRPYLLGVCYGFQICSALPVTGHDVTVDFLAVIPEEIYGE